MFVLIPYIVRYSNCQWPGLWRGDPDPGKFVANADSIQGVPVRVEHERRKFLILDSFLKEPSPVATESSKVQNILKALQMFENSVSKFLDL